jgi:hypothetical protein
MIRNSSLYIADGIRGGGIHVPNATQILPAMLSLIVSAVIRMSIAERIIQMHNAMNVTPVEMQIETFF